MSELRSIQVVTIEGKVRTFCDFLDKAALVVNVASKCGFTPQYEGLEMLYRKYKDRGFAVLGFPCDQFGHQEPGDEAEIRSFCSMKYDVSFPMFAKIEVNGPRSHELYRAMKSAAPGVMGSKKVKWNFTKFLISGRGEVVRRFAPLTAPEKLEGAIASLLP